MEKETTLIKELPTTISNVAPAVSTLPPKRARENRLEMKKYASENSLRFRPKSATGKSNGVKASIRLERALGWQKDGALDGNGKRPGTAPPGSSRSITN